MTKIAALAPTLLGSLALGAGASLIDTMGRKKFTKDQDAANARWLAYQRNKAAEFDTQEAINKSKADAALTKNLGVQDQASREGVIDAEATRLGENYTKGLPEFAQDTLSNSQEAGRSEVFDAAMAKKLAETTASSRERIQALARAGAYGGGTQFGQGQTLGDVLSRAGEDIGFANDARGGATRTLQRYQTVQPDVLEYKQSPLVPILSAASSIVGGMDPSKFTGLFGGGGGAMASSIRPPARPASFSFMPTMPAFTPSFSPMGGGLPGPR